MTYTVAKLKDKVTGTGFEIKFGGHIGKRLTSNSSIDDFYEQLKTPDKLTLETIELERSGKDKSMLNEVIKIFNKSYAKR